ncbi:MAG: MBL fold metallo-hydrolase [Reichenbachiella sp.]|uniref:MBL fold metallo-hydrolase n=1 Tax=Reichenbachiella sp. TaxID=2184521 RepID=UPI0032659E78
MLRSLIYLSGLFSVLSSTSCNKTEAPVQSVDTTEDWYTIFELDDQTWIFEEEASSQANVSYLIAGTERAVMFDSGTGENRGQDGSKIRYKIEEITDLEVTLLLSHFHFDHNQNVAEFDQVAFPELDFLVNAVDEQNIYHFKEKDLFLGAIPNQVEVTEWLPLETDIDLGDRTIQLINLPGHTDESVVVLDAENRLVFLGDFLYNGAIFIFDESDIEVYIESFDKLISMIDEDYILFGGHSTPGVSYNHLLNSRALLDCIQNSDCYQESSTVVFGMSATVYQSLDESATVLLIPTDG